ncbi:Flp pilus assembly protein TadG [Marmoricola sp. URHA0025 HA25]
MQLNRRARDERGAFAVIFGLMIVLLVSVAALGMDLGNAISRKTDTQNQADFAAIDAGQANPLAIAAGAAGSIVPAAVTAQVAASLNSNQPEDDDRACWVDNNCVTTAQLTDCPATPTVACLVNGEVRFTARGRLQVTAPRTSVNFSFAKVFGVDGTDVQSRATVGVFSPGPRIFPMFAVSGCDWGQQALTDPASGSTAVPPLAFDGDSDSQNKVIDGSLVVKDSAANTVAALPLNSTGNTMLINSTAWKNLTKFGFFRGDDTSPAAVVEQPVFWSASDSTQTPLVTPYTTNAGGQLGMNIPNSVAQVETTWYVRAFNNGSGKWTPRSEAQPLAVGRTVLECDSDPTAGNFGTIKLPRTDVPTAQQLYKNIANGLQDPLHLVVHDWARTHTASPPGTCVDGVNFAVVSTGGGATPLKPDTNCVDTVTGVTTGDADQGFIMYNSGHGLLTTAPTHTGCAPGGGSASRTVHLSGRDYTINNDTLSCYLLPGKQLADVQSSTYSGGPAFTADLLNSPRVGYVPVLKVAPSGGSNKYSIIDFRPAFITDEKPGTAASASNGIMVNSSGITQIKVFFFNREALPQDGDIPLIDFLGVGNPIVHLVD